MLRRWATALLLVGMGFLVGSASATLIDCGPDLVYDDVLDITWLRDALCVTLNNCVNTTDRFVTGGMAWADANSWAADLQYGGFSDWRLRYASLAAGASPTVVVYGYVNA